MWLWEGSLSLRDSRGQHSSLWPQETWDSSQAGPEGNDLVYGGGTSLWYWVEPSTSCLHPLPPTFAPQFSPVCLEGGGLPLVADVEEESTLAPSLEVM